MAGFVARGEVPFLHSYAGNEAAVRLYQKQVSTRRAMVVTMLVAD